MKYLTSVELESKEQQIALSQIAFELGLLITRGPMTNKAGSVSLLFRCIARGELLVTPANQDEWDSFSLDPKIDYKTKRKAH